QAPSFNEQRRAEEPQEGVLRGAEHMVDRLQVVTRVGLMTHDRADEGGAVVAFVPGHPLRWGARVRRRDEELAYQRRGVGRNGTHLPQGQACPPELRYWRQHSFLVLRRDTLD